VGQIKRVRGIAEPFEEPEYWLNAKTLNKAACWQSATSLKSDRSPALSSLLTNEENSWLRLLV
jgi:hypothetical protein